MTDVTPEERIADLRKARDAAQAVIDEIERRDIADPFPPRINQRRPKLLEARGQVRDLENIIDDEEAASLVVAIDDEDVRALSVLSAKLDRAITGTILALSGLTAITSVLNAVSAVRHTLNA